MNQFDNAFKILITSFSETFAEWLLGSPPQNVQPLSVELPGAAVRSDLVFDVLQADGTPVLLHIELQGGGSHDPMRWRMLEYVTRLVRREFRDDAPGSLPQLQSVVIYIGAGVGAQDTGQYEVLGADRLPSLSWRYRPIRLWEMEAGELMALDEPPFLALIGQTQLREPEREVGEAITRIRQVEDEVQRGRLLAALSSLITNEEAMKMVEELLDPLDEYLLELPAQQRILRKGREEGRMEGREEGILEGLREAIEEVIVERFDPSVREYRQVSRQLEDLTSEQALQRVLIASIQAEDMVVFSSRLADELPAE